MRAAETFAGAAPVTERAILRGARLADVPELGRCARAAYARYVGRIGREPAPMRADFAALVAAGRVRVIERDGAVAGYVVAFERDGVTLLESVAVFPEHAGRGFGGRLIDSVEVQARRLGHRAVELYTNAAMHENLAFYPRLGYVETDRRREDGFDRVYFRKTFDTEAEAGTRAGAEADVEVETKADVDTGAGVGEDAEVTSGADIDADPAAGAAGAVSDAS